MQTVIQQIDVAQLRQLLPALSPPVWQFPRGNGETWHVRTTPITEDATGSVPVGWQQVSAGPGVPVPLHGAALPSDLGHAWIAGLISGLALQVPAKHVVIVVGKEIEWENEIPKLIYGLAYRT